MLTGWRLTLSKLFILPQRYVMAIMALLAVANAYTMRVCLNLAITQMVRRKTSEEIALSDPFACADMNAPVTPSNSSVYLNRDETVLFEWSEATQGLILGSFYYGYVLTHIPGGMLAERYGGKWVLGIGLLSTSICTIITPVTVKVGGAPALFVLRVIEGLGEGPTMPGLMAMLSRWAPKNERARFGAIVFGGAQIGNIAGSYFSGLIMHEGSWEDVFYMFGLFGLIWFALWTVLCFSTPNTHPYISDSEKKFLNENVDSLRGTKQKQIDPIPWKALLRSAPLWALIIAAIGHDWGYFTMVTDLPKYMTDVLRFNIKSTGILSALPYVAMWIASFIFGIICDFCVKRGYHNITNARKIYTTIAATGPGICIILASYSGCDTTLAVMWFIIAMTLMGSYYSGMKINPLDISPNYAGTTTAMVNGIAAIAAIISPYLIGLLTPDSTLTQWRVAFWVCLGVLMFTNVVYVLFAKGEQEWWDDVKKHGYPDSWKHGPLPTRSPDEETQKEEGRHRYDWNEATQGLLLSAFYYGYVLTHLPGGLLAEKFGGKWTVGIGLLSTSIATTLTPLAVKLGGAVGLFIIRVLEGMGEGPVTPAFVLLLARWVPPSERSRFGAMIFGGAQVGNILGPYLSGLFLSDDGDWANVFYFFGGLGVIWFLFWMVLCYSTPNTHPFISDEERNFLNSNVAASALHKKLDPVPFQAILRSPQLWVLVLAAVGHDWGYFTMITDLPKYFSDVLKFNIQETGLMAALPYIAMYICSFIFAYLCDLCIKKKWHSITTGRKIYTTVSSSLPAIFIILASYSGCDRVQAVGLFIASMAFMGGFYSSVKINAMDIAPNYAGTCSAFVNGLAAISGIITPYLIGLLTPDQTVSQWRIAFWAVFAVLVGTNLVYLIWGSGEQQWWDDVEKIGYPANWTHGPLKKRASDKEKKIVYPKHDHSPVSND